MRGKKRITTIVRSDLPCVSCFLCVVEKLAVFSLIFPPFLSHKTVSITTPRKREIVKTGLSDLPEKMAFDTPLPNTSRTRIKRSSENVAIPKVHARAVTKGWRIFLFKILRKAAKAPARPKRSRSKRLPTIGPCPKVRNSTNAGDTFAKKSRISVAEAINMTNIEGIADIAPIAKPTAIGFALPLFSILFAVVYAIAKEAAMRKTCPNENQPFINSLFASKAIKPIRFKLRVITPAKRPFFIISFVLIEFFIADLLCFLFCKAFAENALRAED